MAIDIEDLLAWTYRQQRAHIVVDRGAGLYPDEARMAGIAVQGRSACGAAAIEAIGLYGARVYGGGMAAGALHEDAEVVHGLVRAVPLGGSLTINHALLHDRPDWLPGAVARLEAVLDARGRPVRAYEPWDRSRHWGWCLLTTKVTQTRIDAQRAEYSAWWSELAWLARQPVLRGLKLWRVTGFSAPPEPWLTSGLSPGLSVAA